MCGVGGIIRVVGAGEGDGDLIPEAWLDLLERELAWRGPDGRGRWRDRATRQDGATVEVALVHTRLAIIDLAGGAQPMVSRTGPRADGTVGVVFNGCVYNHRALRGELQGLGHRFRTDHSDTETLIHAWRQWGVKLTEHLDGMYAAAIWDARSGRCALIRDRAGEKPLYYALLSRGPMLVFGSTIPAVMAVLRAAGGEVTLDPSVVCDWVRFGWDERLPLREVREVGARETLVFPPSGAAREPELAHRVEVARERSDGVHLCADEVGRLLGESVALRTEADVPLGCFLSGGVDSSLVAMYARDRVERLTTLCVRFPGEGFDESGYAAEVARELGTEHVTIDVRPSASSDMVELVERLGLPFGDSSMLAAHWVSVAAREHVKAALAGDGGDELFFGYRRHRAMLLLRRAWGLVRLLPRDAWRLVPRGEGRLARAIRMAVTARTLGYQPTMEWREPDLRSLFPSAETHGPAGITELPDPAIDDFRRYLPFDLLRKEDTASMRAPIEVRAPMLSNDLIRAAHAAPISSIMTGGRLKGVLRDLLARRVPTHLAERPKHGFGVPIGDFMRNDFGGMRALVCDALGGSRPFGPVHDVMEVRVDRVRRIMEEHLEGRREHASRLYHLLALAIWGRWIEHAR